MAPDVSCPTIYIPPEKRNIEPFDAIHSDNEGGNGWAKLIHTLDVTLHLADNGKSVCGSVRRVTEVDHSTNTVPPKGYGG